MFFKVVVLIIFFQIYQIYSKRSAEDIYKILTSYKANYLIVEDAICSEVGPVRGCRVKDLLDIANGHVSNHSENEIFLRKMTLFKPIKVSSSFIFGT